MLPILLFDYLLDLGLGLRDLGDSLREIIKIMLLYLQSHCELDLGSGSRD